MPLSGKELGRLLERHGWRSARLGFWEAAVAFRSSVDLTDLDIEGVYRDVRDRTSGRRVPARG